MYRTTSSSCEAVAWTGWRRKVPVLIFSADALVCRGIDAKQTGGEQIMIFILCTLWAVYEFV